MMVAWTERVRRIWSEPKPPGIDLGNGRMLSAEDVLEGHYRRVAARQGQTASPPHKRGAGQMQQVEVQVSDNLLAAIAVLAPDLVPLTEVAEDVSTTVPHVAPAPQFRRDLHAALERTHRQHAAQRQLGTRPTPAQAGDHRWWPGLLLLGLLGMLFWLWRRARAGSR